MKYLSTRGQAVPVDFRGALLGGLAPDGGLYQPTDLPDLPSGWQSWDYVDAVAWSLEAFGASGARSIVEASASMFRHKDVAPVIEVGDRLIFELFWGPTLSFKDHAMQNLGRLLDREVEGDATIVGATSGDTGSAAIEACRGRRNLNIVILFPDGMVTEFQRRQMTTVPDDNVTALAVRGTFDDCQALVKDAFARHTGLLAINSINWARIAAQAGFYIYLGAVMHGEFDLVVPTGNFGNAYSSWLARRMGVPIGTITLANNANHRLAALAVGSPEEELPVVPTLAPAMDIAVPSNLERLDADVSTEFRAGWVDDSSILATISTVKESHGYLIDPHTATAWKVGESTLTAKPQVVAATAHPAKFAGAVKEATGSVPGLPAGFEQIMDRSERTNVIDNDPSALEGFLR